MPLLLRMNEIKPTMCLAEDFYFGYKVVLPKGWQLTVQDIEYIRSKYPHQVISIMIPRIDNLVDFEDRSFDIKSSMTIRKNIFSLFGQLREDVLNQAELDEEKIANIRLEIIRNLTYIQSNPIKTAILTNEVNDEDYLACHTANVMYLSIIIGEKIIDYIKQERNHSSSVNVTNAKSLTPLAMGAFFHDIGMIPLKRYWETNKCLSPREISQIRRHPVWGYEMLREKIPSMAAAIVHNHHENWNGSGYPRGLINDKINVYARIVRVADAFCAATFNKKNKKGKSPTVVFHEMTRGKYREFYDPVITNALTQVVQPFPIGLRLKMKTGEIALVTSHNPLDTYNPKIIIAFDKQGRLMPKNVLKNAFYLNENENLEILSSIQENLDFLNAPVENTIKAPRKNAQIPGKLLELVYP